ncbi:MAG: phosphonoacetate hydrolase, partial [Planctomycetota bacterium]
DPYVVHHGALGSFVTIHVDDESTIAPIAARLRKIEGVTEVYDRAESVHRLELAADRIGDLCVLSARDVVLGKTPEHHDLSVLDERLRSHGGRYEEMVPLVLSRPLNEEYAFKAQADPRNFDVFDFALHGVQE